MVILAGYGIHRYQLVYMYYKNRKNRTTNRLKKFDELPGSRCSCRFSTSNTWSTAGRIICKMSTKDKRISSCSTTPPTRRGCARGVVERYAALGHPIAYIIAPTARL